MLIIGLLALLILSLCANLVFVKRLFQFDELFDSLEKDIVDAVEYFSSIIKKPMFTNTPEVVHMHNQMVNIRINMINHLEMLNKKSVSKITKDMVA